jgi:integrase
MQRKPTYLYQVRNSKSYFFRVRFSLFEKLCHINVSSKHFVASLKTSDLLEAMSLSQFLISKLTDEAKMMTHANAISVSRHSNNCTSAVKALLNFDEELLRLELHSALKKRFTHWLSVGKKMLQLGVIESRALTNLRTLPQDVLNSHYAQNEDVEAHPSPNKHFLQTIIAQAQKAGISLDPRKADAHMLNRLIAELKKIGKEYENYSPELVGDSPECSINDAPDFMKILTTLPEFTAFGRRVERSAKIRNNKNALLRKCIDDFCDVNFLEIGVSAQQQYRKSFDTLIAYFGADFVVSDFSAQHAFDFQKIVSKIKSGRKAGGIEQTLKVKSINKYLSNISVFCTWLRDKRKLLDTNPFVGMKLKLTGKNQQKRRKFEHNEITALLGYEPKDKREAATFRKAAKWFSPIGIYSGMRLSEIASLKIKDICKEGDIWFFDLTQHNGKNDNALRIIPIHSKLIELGFINFYKDVKESGSKFLFPELQIDSWSNQRDGCGVAIGKWFNRTALRNIGINKNTERESGILIDFHCCRHTVACRFKYHGVDGYIAKQILGHDQSDEITWGTYSEKEGTKLSVMKRVIESLNY